MKEFIIKLELSKFLDNIFTRINKDDQIVGNARTLAFVVGQIFITTRTINSQTMTDCIFTFNYNNNFNTSYYLKAMTF